MSKSIRLSEQWFRRGLWLVSFVFAGFLIGLGGLIVGDLPRVETRVTTETYIDKAAADRARATMEAAKRTLSENQEAVQQAQLKLKISRNESQAARETFNNWLATRGATQLVDQDPELIRRTKGLDDLKAVERKAQQVLEALEQTALNARQQSDKAQQALFDLERVAQDQLTVELRKQELRVFLYRLALTLPLLLIAAWLFVKKRKTTHWPFVWGFIFFAWFAFFVELVPYLPSYGGYIRYLVGIIITALVGHYAIRAMNRYLERQKAAEAMPSEKRRVDLSYELAISRLAKKVCPGCERPVDLNNTANNFCTHCGICIFNSCTNCNTRKSAFSRFCHSCGTVAAGVPQTE